MASTRERSRRASAGFRYGDIVPTMIGLSARKPPDIKVMRYDEKRLHAVQALGPELAIQAIAAHLFDARKAQSLKQMYACAPWHHVRGAPKVIG